MSDVLTACDTAIAQDSRLSIGVVNAAKIVNMRHDSALRAAVTACDIVLADGQAVVWASKLLRQPLPERIAGVDLFERLLEQAAARGHRVFLLGATNDILRDAIAEACRRWPKLLVAGFHDGYFSADEAEEVATTIRESDADLLFVGMTSPKKELFLDRWGDSLGVNVLHGVGGSIDVLAGKVLRAPVAWQRLGMEWLYRVKQEPRRLWKRYLFTNSAFLSMLVSELLRPTHVPHPVEAAPAAFAPASELIPRQDHERVQTPQ